MLDPSYFDEKNFINKKYSYLHEDTNYSKENTMHICFNLDCKYFHQLGVAVTSVLENNKEVHFVFHIFIDKVQDADVERIKQVVEKYKSDVHIYIMKMEPFSHFHIRHKRFNHVAYFRVYMPKILNTFTKRYLYMDTDMICVSSLQPFFNIDMQNKSVAVVSDFPDAVAARGAFLKLKSDKYFNSGMMWVDVAEWEKQQITEHCFEYVDKDPKCFTAHDQDILNLVLDGNFVLLSKIYNFLGNPKAKAPDDLILYHFFGRIKPWDVCLSNYDKLWRHYCEISFWDNISNILPPKKSKYYPVFKFAGEYFLDNHQYLKALECYWTYSILKIKLKLLGEKSE